MLVLLSLYFCSQRKYFTDYTDLYALLNNLPWSSSVVGGPIFPGPMAPRTDEQFGLEKRKKVQQVIITCVTFMTGNALNLISFPYKIS